MSYEHHHHYPGYDGARGGESAANYGQGYGQSYNYGSSAAAQAMHG